MLTQLPLSFYLVIFLILLSFLFFKRWRGNFERCSPSSLDKFLCPAMMSNSEVIWFQSNMFRGNTQSNCVTTFYLFLWKKGFFFFFGNEMKITFTQFSGGRFWYVEHNMKDQSQCHTYPYLIFVIFFTRAKFVGSKFYTQKRVF